MTLVLGAGAEELLPKFLGVGFPILLTATQFFATGRGTLAATMWQWGAWLRTMLLSWLKKAGVATC